MKKLFYTSVFEYRISVDDQGNLPKSLYEWICSLRLVDPSFLDLLQLFISKAGFTAKVSLYCTAYLLNCHCEVHKAANAVSKDFAWRLLNDIISDNERELLINPKYHPEAQKVIDQFGKRFSVGCQYKPYKSTQPYVTD